MRFYRIASFLLIFSILSFNAFPQSLVKPLEVISEIGVYDER